jgi:arsenate reductase
MKPPEQRPFKVLFVCVGNAIRSQMAEAFARKYGSDVLAPQSAGIAPASSVMPQTRIVMAQRGIDIGEAFPKSINVFAQDHFDYVVNISGTPLRVPDGTTLADWTVPDPAGESDARYVETAEKIEALVMKFILDLRAKRKQAVSVQQPIPFDIRAARRARG